MTNFLIGIAVALVIAVVATRGAGGLLIEWHGWRGVGLDRDLFMVGPRLGFVTVMVFRGSIVERLVEILRQLKIARDGQRGNDE